MNHYGNNVISDWIQKNFAKYILAIFSIARLFDETQRAMPDKRDLKKAYWKEFIEATQNNYKLTETLTPSVTQRTMKLLFPSE